MTDQPIKPPTTMTREALSLQRAAFLLDVSTRTLRRWHKSGHIKLVRVGPALLRVPRDEVARLRRGTDPVTSTTMPAEAVTSAVKNGQA